MLHGAIYVTEFFIPQFTLPNSLFASRERLGHLGHWIQLIVTRHA